jgi:ketosteroid isomerase-like protein
VSEENVAIVRAIFETDATTNKEEILKALPAFIPGLFHPDAEWIEAPERVDAKTYRGHDGIRRSFEHWLDQWEDYRFEALRFEDHGDHVLVVARESGQGQGSGASIDAMVYSVLTFHDGKISRYREFYDEATARAIVG